MRNSDVLLLFLSYSKHMEFFKCFQYGLKLFRTFWNKMWSRCSLYIVLLLNLFLNIIKTFIEHGIASCSLTIPYFVL